MQEHNNKNSWRGLSLSVIILHIAAGILFYGILRKMTPLDFLTFEVTVGVNSLVAWFGLATLPVLAAAAWREQWVAAFFSWFPWLTVALFALFCMCCPAITWWVVCVIALCLWLSCAVQRLVMQKWQRLSYILVAFDLLLFVTLFLDFHYFSITRAHISFQHIFVVLIGIMGRRDLAQFFKIIGVSYYHAAMLAVMIAAITAFTVVLMRFGSSVKPLAAKFMRNLVASFLLLGCVIASFSPLAGSLPFENYLEWRLNNCFFRLPDHPRLQNPAISAALNDTTVKLNFEQTARQGDYSWLAEPSTCNIVFLFVESWRPDMFEAYMPQTRELATRGMWLKNHFATTNDSLGGTTAVYYSTIPFLGPHGFASFFKPSTWLDFMKKSGYNLRRISNVGVTLAYPDYQYIGVEDAEKENAIQSPAGMSPVATGRTLSILLQELQKPGAHILEGVLYDTHYNYTYPPEFEKYKPVADVNADFIASGYDQTAVAGLANRYKNACGYIDHELGCFFRQVKNLGLDKNTIFVILGDHGECLGEDGNIFHATGPHINQFHTVALLLGPMIAPQIIEAPTAHEDIIPTLAGFMGFTASATTGINPRIASRSALIQYDISSNRRLLVRRDDHMTIFQVNNDGTLPWLATTRNNFTIDAELFSLFNPENLGKLSAIITADRHTAHSMLVRQ